MTARDEILRGVRDALGRANGQPPPPPPPVRLTPKAMPVEARIDSFCTRLEALGGTTYRAADLEDARIYVERVTAGGEAVASRAPLLVNSGITAIAGVRTGFATHADLKAACASAAFGISSASYALADTGTLVMLAGPDEERLISLLPPLHIAILPRERLLTSLDDLLEREPLPVASRSSMVLITGPSRTGDIEQILVRGVHGPGEIHVVIV